MARAGSPAARRCTTVLAALAGPGVPGFGMAVVDADRGMLDDPLREEVIFDIVARSKYF